MTDDEEDESMTEHHWSGWPGAFCFHCGSDDPMETAIGNGWYDPYSEKWISDKKKLKYEAANVCKPPEIPWSKVPCPQCKVKT